MTPLDISAIRRDFPILEREVNGRRITYLDSASSAQKPFAVLDAMDDCYRRYYANIHRGVYTIAARSRDSSARRRSPRSSS
jgi:cysteine desulfurase / selenocysteine lyase